jgi:hypothetical protein
MGSSVQYGIRAGIHNQIAPTKPTFYLHIYAIHLLGSGSIVIPSSATLSHADERIRPCAGTKSYTIDRKTTKVSVRAYRVTIILPAITRAVWWGPAILTVVFLTIGESYDSLTA